MATLCVKPSYHEYEENNICQNCCYFECFLILIFFYFNNPLAPSSYRTYHAEFIYNHIYLSHLTSNIVTRKDIDIPSLCYYSPNKQILMIY